MNFINNINGIWKINRKVSATTNAQGYAKISKNKNSEIIINEKFLTIHNQNIISGYNEYLIKITKSKILFFFHTGPNCGKLFQKFELNFFPKSSFYYCLKDTYVTNIYWLTKNYFRITHKIKGKNKNLFINSHYFKTNNSNLFNKFI